MTEIEKYYSKMLSNDGQSSDDSSGQSIEDDSLNIKLDLKTGTLVNIQSLAASKIAKSQNEQFSSPVSSQKNDETQLSVSSRNQRKRKIAPEEKFKMKRFKRSESQESLNVSKVDEEDKKELENDDLPQSTSKICTYARKVPFCQAKRVHTTKCL